MIPLAFKYMLNCTIIGLCSLETMYGQSDTAKVNPYEGLSLKDLLNIKITSVSKKPEALFEAPLSASVLTREEIRQSGSTSIMEALRLVPGMIVREESNGNYDIHVRGMDNIPPNTSFDLTSNTTTMVMIDNRPVYSYLRGGTFWESLPIDLNDVEKIEVIRGPAAALYGPNAATGVINIITRQPEKDDLYLVANAHQGSYHSSIENLSAGYRFSRHLNVVASGNYQHRDRPQTSYFELYRNVPLDRPAFFINFSGDTVTDVQQRYPDMKLAMDKYAGNIFLNYDNTKIFKFSLAAGAQHSTAQRVSTENEITPLSVVTSSSRYIDFRANGKGLAAQLSFNGGTQSTDDDPGRKYDFNTIHANIEYSYTRGHLSLKPGFNYYRAVIDDRKYSDLVARTGLINGRGDIISRSAFLRGDYLMLKDKLRIVAGMATSTFNHPDDTYISYEFAATYKINPNHLFRAVYSRAPRSLNIFDVYVSKTISYIQTGIRNFTTVIVEGNKDPDLLTTGMLEGGYRGRIAPGLDIDVEAFEILARNYNVSVINRPYTRLSGTDTITVLPIRSTTLPLRLVQRGVTVSLIWNRKKFQVKPFVTIQRTKAKNYAPYVNTPDAAVPNAAINNIYSGLGNTATLKSTPIAFGGLSFNYTLLPELNINLNSYYYSRQTYTHLSNILFDDGIRGIDHIPAKLILSVAITYEPVKGLEISCSGKNILNDRSREFFKTDQAPFMLFGGIHYEF